PSEWSGLGELLCELRGPVLDLALSSFRNDPLPELCRLPGLASLRRLELWSCTTSDAGVDALATCASLAGLRGLAGLSLGPEHLRRLADAPLLSELRCLSFYSSAMGDSGALAMLNSPRLRKLRELRMMGANIGRATVEALVAWPGLGRLRHLSLCNGLTHET